MRQTTIVSRELRPPACMRDPGCMPSSILLMSTASGTQILDTRRTDGVAGNAVQLLGRD
jgi:hypothetical protein